MFHSTSVSKVRDFLWLILAVANVDCASRWQCLCYAIAFQFSQCVVTLLAAIACIAKPQLFNWQMCLVSEETAVFTPYIIILITVTSMTTYTRVGHPTCALTTARWCPAPVRHLTRITWHPEAISATNNWTITFILNELFTIWVDSGETRQLRQTRSCVMDVTWVTTISFTSLHESSAFTVVTNHCHANATLATHVAVNGKWCQASRAIWINDVISAYITAVCSDRRTGSIIIAFKAISNVTLVTLARIWATFICTAGMLMTLICLSFAFI